MITLIVSITEDERIIHAEGSVVGFNPTTAREEEMVRGMVNAIERYCARERDVMRGTFIRGDWASVESNGKDDDPA